MTNECSISHDREGERLVYRLAGTFDRAAAWALRARLEHDDAASELVLDFSLVRDFSDLGVAVLAHALTAAPRRVVFRGLRQHQVRIFRYCGLAIEETSARESVAGAPAPVAADTRA